MRHALIPVRLFQESRAASAPARQVADALPDPKPVSEPRPRRVASLFARARARARTLGLGAESPGGGA
jgi:hypothetical protein